MSVQFPLLFLCRQQRGDPKLPTQWPRPISEGASQLLPLCGLHDDAGLWAGRGLDGVPQDSAHQQPTGKAHEWMTRVQIIMECWPVFPARCSSWMTLSSSVDSGRDSPWWTYSDPRSLWMADWCTAPKPVLPWSWGSSCGSLFFQPSWGRCCTESSH